MNSKAYYDDLKKGYLYFIVLLALFIFLGIFNISFIEQLTGANLILAIIAVPCCLLHYYSDRTSSFFIYILIFTSICIEAIYKWHHSTNNFYTVDLLLPFSYRVFLLIILLYSNSEIIKKCMKHTRLIFILSLIIDIILVFINSHIINHSTLQLNMTLLFFIVASISYIVIIKLTIKTLHEHNFILTIYNMSIIVLAARLLFMLIFDFLNISHNKFAEDKVFFFVALWIILIGQFIRAKQVLNINRDLNKDVKDISENVRQIQQLEKMRNSFFANLSHEFKTPLNIISSTLQLLELNKNQSNDALLNSYLKYEPIIKQNCYRMMRLTNNFVDLSKIDAGYMKLHFKNHNIVQLVEDITMSVVFYVENKKINIIFDTTDEEMFVKCDSDAIERIVLNLLSNSTKYTKENGNISVNLSSDDDYIYINVKDDGCGIKKELRDNIFKMYVQDDKTNSQYKEGSGIGLSLVRSLAILHSGDAYLVDTDIGTEIVVKIPNVTLPQNDDAHKYNIEQTSHGLIEKIDIEFSDIYGLK